MVALDDVLYSELADDVLSKLAAAICAPHPIATMAIIDLTNIPKKEKIGAKKLAHAKSIKYIYHITMRASTGIYWAFPPSMRKCTFWICALCVTKDH